MAAVFADVDLSDRPDAETIERRLRVAFQAHGEESPRYLTGTSQLIAAGSGRRGTRTARFLALGAGALARGARWAWQPDAGADARDRRALRAMYGSFAALVGIAAVLTTGAIRASGWRRLPWAVAALPVWLFTGGSLAVGALLTMAAREARSAPPPESQTL